MSRKAKALEFENQGYDFQVTGRHVDVTEAMKNYAIEKVSKLEKFTDRIIEVVITMDIQRIDHRVDIKLKFNNIKIKSTAVTTDMYASIDLAVDRLQAQISKYKSRLNDHHAKGAYEVDMNVNVISPNESDSLHDINNEIDDENHDDLIKKYDFHKVVSTKKKPMKVLNMDEAIMRMELSQDAFLIYRSEEDRKIKVIYKRYDGNYGIIEPE